jgi:hypothetical protein
MREKAKRNSWIFQPKPPLIIIKHNKIQLNRKHHNKGSKVRKHLFVSTVLLACTSALAAEGRWIEGFGQGNLEYFIDKQGYRLYIGCPTEGGSAELASSVSLYQIESDKEVAQFTITLNGSTYDAPFEADSHVGESNFVSLIEDLRKGSAIVKFGKKTISFPKSNAKQVIPAPHTKDFSCNLLWSNPPDIEKQ